MTCVAANDWPGSFPTASTVGCIYGLGHRSGRGTSKGRGKGQAAVCGVGADIEAMESGIELNIPVSTER